MFPWGMHVGLMTRENLATDKEEAIQETGKSSVRKQILIWVGIVTS